MDSWLINGQPRAGPSPGARVVIAVEFHVSGVTTAAQSTGRRPVDVWSPARPEKPSSMDQPGRDRATQRIRVAPERITACLFDLDGVLTSTAAQHMAAWQQTFDAFLREREGERFSDRKSVV